MKILTLPFQIQLNGNLRDVLCIIRLKYLYIWNAFICVNPSFGFFFSSINILGAVLMFYNL